MDSTIFASILGGVATVIAAFISPLVANKMQERKKSKFMPSAPLARQNALYGAWVGEMDQQVGLDRALNKHILHIQFIENSKPIIGKMKLEFNITGEAHSGEDSFIEAKVINTVYDGWIFKCDYVNKDNNAIHFGTLFGKLSSSGNEIRGEFLGYGLYSERFVSGTIGLKKQDSLTRRSS